MAVRDAQLLITIEKVIKVSDLPPKKAELRRALPRHTAPRAFEAALDHLRASGKVLVDKEGRVVWVAVDNERLRKLVDSAVRVR